MPTNVTFNPPPGWPAAPGNWLPQATWTPSPSWPAAPAGWPFYRGAYGEPVPAPAGCWNPASVGRGQQMDAGRPAPAPIPSPTVPAVPAPAPVRTPNALAATMPVAVATPGAAIDTRWQVDRSTTWTSREASVVILVGLVGGLLGGLLLQGYYLAGNGLYDSLGSFPWDTSWGVVAVLLTTHCLFAGMLVRKPGVIIATTVITLVPVLAVIYLVEPLWAGYSLSADDLPWIFQYTLLGVLIVGGVAELLQAVLPRPGSFGTLSLFGFVPGIGWGCFYVVQWLVPGFGAYWSADSILVGFVLALILGYLFSGLLPAAISRAVSSSAAVTVVESVGVRQPPGVGGIAPAGLVEHPKASTVLAFGVIGLVAFAPLAIAAWVIGARASREVREQPGVFQSGGSLQTGYILGIVGTIVWVLGLIFLILFYGALFAAYAGMG